MEGFLPVLIIFIIYAFIGSSMKKKAEQTKQAQRRQAAAPAHEADKHTPQPPQQKVSGMDDAAGDDFAWADQAAPEQEGDFSTPQAPHQKISAMEAAAGDDSTWTDRVNAEVHRGENGTLHPTERKMTSRLDTSRMDSPVMNDDGGDACHAYMLDDEALPGCIEDMPEHDYDAPRTEGEFSSLTREDILRGVVMSEILTRPGQRRMARRRS